MQHPLHPQPSAAATTTSSPAEPRKPKAPRPPARQPAPLPPLPTEDSDSVGGGADENNDPEKGTRIESGFIQLTDNKLFVNDSSHC